MITEVLLALLLYAILFVVWLRLWYAIKIMADAENIFNDEEFFGDTVDTPKVGIEQNRKRE